MRSRWARVLAGFLMIWEPMRVAAELESAAGTLSMRGWTGMGELLLHAAIAAACVASGWALWNGNPAGPRAAAFAVGASAATTVQSLYWSALPHQTVPGEQLPFAILAVANAAAWMVFLGRSRRVQEM
jgi:hypothetical protein